MTSTGCAIVGSAETEVGRALDRTGLDLKLDAATKAIRDAGLTKTQIDGVVAWQPRREPVPNHSAFVAEQLGIAPRYVADISLGGAACASTVVSAVAAIRAGLASTVLCLGGDGKSSVDGKGRRGRLASHRQDFRNPYGGEGAPILYGLMARRHMHEYGTTSEQLGAVAVACRRHASLNPNSQMRQPITIADHQASPMVVDPLRRLDCSLISDGAGAVVVTSAERARDLPHKVVHILGMATACRYGDVTYQASMTTSAAVEASRAAFGAAGITPEDVDLVELYDCFTHVVLIQIEDYGFCAKGESGSFVEGGRIEIGGQLPVNTHGGLLSQAHVGGMLHITEGVTQIRGDGGERQVENARIAVVSGQCGELGIHVTLVLGSERT
ncbi:MAG TPA: thiolase family protein [Chloroflexota bacterium]|nr:thiolase family protein [Chloroflexota bacterium]